MAMKLQGEKQLRPALQIIAQTAYADDGKLVSECSCSVYISKPLAGCIVIYSLLFFYERYSGVAHSCQFRIILISLFPCMESSYKDNIPVHLVDYINLQFEF